MNLFFSVLVGGGQVWEQHVDCRERLRTICQERGIGLTISRDAGTGVDRARNRQVEVMRAMNAAEPDPAKRHTHFMFCDNDIIFNPENVVKMMQSELDVTAAVYPRKAIDYEHLAKAVRSGVPDSELPYYATSFIFNHWYGRGISSPELGTFVEVGEVGTGFLMVKAEVFEKFVRAYGRDIEYKTDYEPRDATHHCFFQCQRDPDCEREAAAAALRSAAESYNSDLDALLEAVERYKKAAANPEAYGRYLTEDYAFCRLARKLGYKIYAHIDSPLGHMGTHCFHGDVRKGLSLKVTTDDKEEGQPQPQAEGVLV